MSLSTPALRIVLYEGPEAETLDTGSRFDLIRTLLERGFGVTRASNDSAKSVSGPDQTPLMVLGRFEGQHPVQRESENGEVSVHFADISNRTPEQVIDAVESVRSEKKAAQHGTWKPWFPVIDYDR